MLLGTSAAWFYAQAGLTLSHYDAKAHLVVARRVIDSLTPGWKQIGAVWLPLPHLLNLLPVQIDACYRTGASAVALSVLSFGLMAYACTRLILDATGSRAAAFSGLAVVALNPDILYLQSTPMTEPLLLGLTALSVALLSRWVDSDAAGSRTPAGLAMAAACLTRYEAWPMTAAALLVAALALWRRGLPFPMAVRRVAGARRVSGCRRAWRFCFQSRLTVGQWFVTDGFYVADNPDTGRAFKTIGSIWWASHHLNGYGVLLCGVAGAAAVLVAGLRSRSRASLLVALAMVGAAALPWYAFFSGHPFRFRYMVPLVPALAVWAGLGVGLLRRYRIAAAALLVALTLIETRPFSLSSPMVVEAQLDREHAIGRRTVTEFLRGHRDGGLILASLGSLSHYVQELSRIGVNVRDVVHEGNGELWTAALESPRSRVRWILIEELCRRRRRAGRPGEGPSGVPERLHPAGRGRGRRPVRPRPSPRAAASVAAALEPEDHAALIRHPAQVQPRALEPDVLVERRIDHLVPELACRARPSDSARRAGHRRRRRRRRCRSPCTPSWKMSR